MKIKKIFVEQVEKQIGQVLPKVETNEGSFLGRNLPISNRIAFIENIRVKYLDEKPFPSKICFATVPSYKDIKLEEYANMEIKGILNKPQNDDRIKLIGLQRKYDDREKLMERESCLTFETFVETGEKYIPIEIPFIIKTLQDFKIFKKNAESILNPNQELIIDAHTSQSQKFIGEILINEINDKSKFLYLSTKTLNESSNALACAKIWDIMKDLKYGTEIPLIVAKHPKRYQESFMNASSSFTFNCFNIPIVVEYYHNPPEEAKKKFEDKDSKEYYIYDIPGGGFVKSKFQDMLNNTENSLKRLFKTHNIGRGIRPYDMILCLNFLAQQEDTSLQNDAINNNNFLEIINNKESWKMFYKYCFKPNTKLIKHSNMFY